MKELYQNAEMDLVEFAAVDVIATSNNDDMNEDIYWDPNFTEPTEPPAVSG